ncbi:MAG TPA: TIGR00730 family Rossman fold protein [Candidatus Cybelea sp.]
MKRICVFCGSHTGNGEAYAQMAREVTEKIVAAGYGIVYGGGSVGLMAIVADTALARGGEVIGVIPQALARTEIAHPGLTELHVVKTMHERKAIMDDASDAFIALPGGFGTMDEFCEVLSWRQLRIHDKPIGLLNYRGYYDALLSLFDHMLAEGFIGPHTRRLFTDAENIDELLTEMFEPRNAP